MLRGEGVRLLTLTGPAGVGKTRLAVEVGNRLSGDFPQGVVFVDLSPIQVPPQALARGVGLQDVESKNLSERLFAYLRERRSLVILDNFEQVLDAAEWVAELLAACPSVVLLVTSREPLRLRWEQTYRVPPLAFADPDHLLPLQELAGVPAVALFIERARALDSGFELGEENARAVAELCARLDGLPLAVELAAARTGVLSPRMILARLGERLSLLKWEARDLPERQQTLRQAIGWSYEQLNEQERALFLRLGVFAGGFTMEAAQAIASGGEDRLAQEELLDGLASLVDKSLVQTGDRSADDIRYRMLESIREYALEQSRQNDEHAATSQAHALYFLGLAERGEPELIGAEQRAWFLRLEQEHDDLRAAIEWFSSRGEDVPALRLAAALGYFCWAHGYFAEGRRLLEDLVGRAPGDAAGPRTRATALRGLGILLLLQGERARTVLEDALAAARSAREARSITLSLAYLGIHAMLSGKAEESAPFLEEALVLARGATDAWGIALALHLLGVAALHAQDYVQAERLLEEARAGYLEVGDERSIAEVLVWLGPVVQQRGYASRAAALVRQAVEVSRRLEDRRLFNMCTDTVVWLAGEEADPGQLARLMGVNEALHQVTGLAPGVWEHTPFASAIATLGTHLDEDSVAAARTEGYALSLEKMAELALEVLDGPTNDRSRHAEQNTLSPRELEVLGLVAEGFADREIAGRLFITERTVRHHLTSVFSKLGAENRTQAVTLAGKRNLL